MERYQERVGSNKACFRKMFLWHLNLSGRSPDMETAVVSYSLLFLLFSKLRFQVPMWHSTQHKWLRKATSSLLLGYPHRPLYFFSLEPLLWATSSKFHLLFFFFLQRFPLNSLYKFYCFSFLFNLLKIGEHSEWYSLPKSELSEPAPDPSEPKLPKQ